MLLATVPQWYAFTIGGIALIWLVIRVVVRVIRLLVSYLGFYFLRYLAYRSV